MPPPGVVAAVSSSTEVPSSITVSAANSSVGLSSANVTDFSSSFIPTESSEFSSFVGLDFSRRAARFCLSALFLTESAAWAFRDLTGFCLRLLGRVRASSAGAVGAVVSSDPDAGSSSSGSLFWTGVLKACIV